MPYLITTRPPRPQYGFAGYPRTAVATLDEAAAVATATVESTGDWTAEPLAELREQARELPAEGGTIALPDGTVIEVRPAAWSELAELAGFDLPYLYAEDRLPSHDTIIAAYNRKNA